MKKSLILAMCASTIAAYALPTYEPFTEYATQASATGTNALDLALGNLIAPGGESWGALNFSGTAGTGIKGVDIQVTNMTTGSPFTTAALTNILPTNFPGFPTGTAITTFVANPAQLANANTVGNSAVLKFAQDITRPTNGTTTTLYISYLFSVAQKGQTGAGNIGRYLGFLASSNLVEGTNVGPVAYTNWASLFNTFSPTSPKYFGHGVFNGAPEYIEPYDNAKGIEPAAPPTTFSVAFNAPAFIVGEFVFLPTSQSPAKQDTNIIWVNPAISGFGGATPPTSPVNAFSMTNVMTDVGGMVLIDRVGSGASGGVGSNYVANLLIGSTWSYVTGGPEFTNQPAATTLVNLGQNATLTGSATAAAQSVTYQWQKISGGVTNNLSDGSGNAGGSATVSGSTTTTLTLTGVSASDVGTFQLVAKSSGTGFVLVSSPAVLQLADPQVTVSPPNTTVNYGQAATLTAQVTTANAPLSYQWYNGSTPLSNGLQADGSTLTGASGTTGAGTSFTLSLGIANPSYLDDGIYTLFVTNNINLHNASIPATLTVNDPAITAQPSNQAVPAGNNAHFTVSAVGSPNVTYQWFENGVQLSDGGTTTGGSAVVSGSSSPTLTLTDVQDGDDGQYYVIVSSGSGQSVTSATNSLTAVDALVFASAPKSLTERVGDHTAFSVGVVGPLASFQWSFNGTPILGATNSALVLTNIQTTNQGTYSAVVSNLVTPQQTFSATLNVINSAILPVSSTNLIISRVGDGAQPLSGATGNTIYLDQYTTNGVYVSTIQVPDENVGQAYGTGSSQSVFGSPALLAQGAGTDAANGVALTLSGGNQQYLNFTAYCAQYPFSGADVTVGQTSGPFSRGFATVNAFGIYALAYTNSGLYSGGNHTIRSVVTLDGTNFWSTGQAGSGGLKFVSSAVNSYATGNGIPSLTSSAAGNKVVQIASGNIVFSDDAGAGGNGIYAALGTPEPAPSGSSNTALIINTGGIPNDFAFSPDGQTVYIADSQNFGATNDQTGGIQRWDTNTSSGGWSYSYSLQPIAGSTVGAQNLTVDFSANASWGSTAFGAKLYVTTTGASTNSLVAIVDNGPASASTVITSAGLGQALRGVRFGPAAIPVSIVSQPRSQTNFPANSVTFSVGAAGSLPIFYQWQFNGTNIAGATQSTFTTNNISFASAGNYSVVVSNLVPSSSNSFPAVLTVTAGAPTFTTGVPSFTEGQGEHLAFAPAVSGSLPLNAQWYFNDTNHPISGATNVSLILTNIQPSQSGTYIVYVSNIFGTNHASGSLTVTLSPSALSSNNIIVARIGDGAQALSGVTGNTVYLDQYTPGGTYVSSLQVPDEGIGQPYGTGGSSSTSMPFGSQALLVAGGNLDGDAAFEGLLTRSGDGQTLNFAGYVEPYPFAGPDLTVGANGGANWRGVGSVGAFGFYSTVYTNTGLYSGGNHQVHNAVTLDQTNYWTTGEAGSGGIKYITPAFQPASGGGIVVVGGSDAGTRVIQIINQNLLFTDAGASPPGLYSFGGLPNSLAVPSVVITETNSPMDFAESPDNNTIYIADNGTFLGTNAEGGGIQRWDNNGSGYVLSYTLPTGTNSTAGARGLVVNFVTTTPWGPGVNGAVLYATTSEASGNRLIKITDNGPASVATTLTTALPTETLSGVRFGPVALPVSITQEPQSEAIFVGSGATFSVSATGSQPISYQWQFNGANISGATDSTLTVSPAQAALPGNYTVLVGNPITTPVASTPASLTFLPVLTFNGNGSGWSKNGTASSGLPIYNFDGASNDVELTQGIGSQASSTFYGTQVYVGGFLATWTYQVINPSGALADGIAFVVQNDPHGTAALGGVGGLLGYGSTTNGITNSVALEFNIFATPGVGIAFDTNGAIGPNLDVTPISLTSGDPINVTLEYVNGLATVTLNDPNTGDTFTTNGTLNVPAVVGGNEAYVGFTGADGGSVSTQVIRDFVFTSLVNLSAFNTGSNTLALTWPTNTGAYTLQQNANLTTTNWSAVTNSVSVVNGVNETVVPIGNGDLFYRLVIP